MTLRVQQPRDAGPTGARLRDDAARLRDAARRGDEVDWLARAGLVAEAVLYGTLAVLAAQVALDGRDASHRPDAEGALQLIADQPLGQAVLVLVALGFLAQAVRRLVEASADRDGHGSGAEGLAKRGGLLALGVVYLGLTGLTLAVAFGKRGGSSSSQQEQEAAQGVLGWPLGRELVLVAGAALVVGAAAVAVWALTRRHDDTLDATQLSARERRVVSLVGAAGQASRAAVFGVIGVFLVRAAWQQDPGETRGLDGALLALAGGPAGPLVLGVLALGFAAFAAWCVVQARYRLG